MGHHSRKVKERRSSPQSPSSPSTSTNSSANTDVTTSSSGGQFESSSKHHKRRRRKEREGGEKQSFKKSRRDYERRKSKTTKRTQGSRDGKKKKSSVRKKRRYDSDEGGGDSASESESESPEDVIKYVLKQFPAVAGDLEQLLQMIDQGQAVDIKGLSERSLVKHLRRLFTSLNLKEKGDQVFLLPDKAGPTLDVVGRFIRGHIQSPEEFDHLDSGRGAHSVRPGSECRIATDNVDDEIGPRRRVIGPEIPSAELLAAAAKLTEAEAELREAELDGEDGIFIGPPPPAVVTEAASANEAERFEEITRIIDAEENSPYDIIGVNINMPSENIKKRYWKLSLMVHPDKCSHPQAHQAFVKLNKAFKDLQDPDKRKILDDKIKLKEEQEALKAELKQMREAAQWRRLQGISMEGDDLLLADMDTKITRRRDEWMTSLPPERAPGVPMHSTTRFGKGSREGRGDVSSWTDTPSERAQKARTNYLEAFNETKHLASNEQGKQKATVDADLVDQYNKANRSKSLLEKHKELAQNRSKKKIKQQAMKEEWEGNHPWKPWDREKDLAAGRQNVKLGSENIGQGLSSRFSSGSFQRSFL